MAITEVTPTWIEDLKESYERDELAERVLTGLAN
jgi:hypothetical protein